MKLAQDVKTPTAEKKAAERWLEIGAFGWLVRYEYSDTWLDFKAYEAVCSTSSDFNRHEQKQFESKGDPNDYVRDPNDARIVLSGFVKWDGCCEFTWPEEPLHFCGVHAVEDFGKVLLAVHALAKDVLPSFDRKCAGY